MSVIDEGSVSGSKGLLLLSSGVFGDSDYGVYMIFGAVWIIGVFFGLVAVNFSGMNRHLDVMVCWWKLNVSYTTEVGHVRSMLQYFGVPLQIASDQQMVLPLLAAAFSAALVRVRNPNGTQALQ